MRTNIFRCLVPATSGTLHVLNPVTGAQTWSFVAGPMFASPSVVSNYVLVGSDDGNLYGLTPGIPPNVVDDEQPFGHYGPGSHPNQQYEGDPVSTSTGNLLHQKQDIATTGGPGLPIGFTRTYNSMNAGTDGPLGYGWSSDSGAKLSVLDTTVRVVWGDGRVDLFFEQPGGAFASPEDSELTLRRSGNQFFIVDSVTNTTATFNTSGRIQQLSDKWDNVTQYEYAADRLTKITDASGRSVTFSHDNAGRIVRAQGPMAHQRWAYTYSSAGDLIEVTDPADGIWRYSYDSAHRMLAMTDPSGDVLMANTYLGDTGKVASQLDANRERWTYVYEPGRTVVTDPTDVATTYYFDANFRTVRTVESSGEETRKVYDAASNLLASVDAAGGIRRYIYDSSGNLTTSVDPLGHSVSFRYDSNDQLISETTLKGAVTSYSYDARGSMIRATSPTGLTTSQTFRPDGLPESTTKPGDRTVRYTYTASGHLRTLTDPAGATTTYDLRVDGRPRAITNPAGGTTRTTYDLLDRRTSSTTPEGATTSWTYDDRGHVIAVQDPNGNTTETTFDPKGQQVARVDPLGRTSRWDWDPAGRLASTTDPRGVTTTSTYDQHGRLATVTRPDETVAYTYDDAGRRKSVANGHSTLTYTYDAMSRPTAETDSATGTTVAYAYDMVGRRSRQSVILADGRTFDTGYRYDREGRPLQVLDADQKPIRMVYDAAGDLALMTHANGTQTRYSYDPLGRVESIRNTPTAQTDIDGTTDGPLARGSALTGSLLTLSGELADPANAQAGLAVAAALQRLITSATAPGAGLTTILRVIADLAEVTDTSADFIDQLADGPTLKALQDAVADMGDLVQSLPASIAADQLTDLAEDLSDEADELTATVTGLQNEITAATRLTANTLRLARALLNSEDGASESTRLGEQLTEVSNDLTEDVAQINRLVDATREVLIDLLGVAGPLQSDWTYERDSKGQVIRAQRRFVGADNELLSFVYTYAYDADGRIVAATSTDPASAVFGNATYTYDSAGNRLRTSVAGAVPVTATFDRADQLRSDTFNTYTYDDAGNMTSRVPIGQDNGGTTFEWDAAGRLKTYTDPLVSIANTYDPTGRRAVTVTTNQLTSQSETESATFSEWDLLFSRTDGFEAGLGDTAFTLLDGRALGAISGTSRMSYQPDVTGNITDISDRFGNGVVRNAYGPWGEATSIAADALPLVGQSVDELGYSGSWGVRNSGAGHLDMRNRQYDPLLGQFLSRDPLVDATNEPYRYANGNPVTVIDPYGLCGWTDPLGCVSDGAGWVVDNSGTLSAISAGIAVVGYASCPFTAGIGCTIGGVASYASFGLAGVGAVDTCLREGLGSQCAVSVADVGLSFGGLRLPSKFLGTNPYNPKHLSNFQKNVSYGGYNVVFGGGACATSDLLHSVTEVDGGCFTALGGLMGAEK